MAAQLPEYTALPKEAFAVAEWLGDTSSLEGVSPRWQGYSAELPDRGATTLYPLRESNFGPILPHLYAEKMLRADRIQKGSDRLTDLNLRVNMMNDLNGSVDYDESTSRFHSLIGELGRPPYNERPELSGILKEVFKGYRDMREAQRIQAAKAFSRTIRQHELYVVACDSNDGELYYATRLAGIISRRKGDEMNFKLVVADADGKEGFLPKSFYIPGGVSAPAA